MISTVPPSTIIETKLFSPEIKPQNLSIQVSSVTSFESPRVLLSDHISKFFSEIRPRLSTAQCLECESLALPLFDSEIEFDLPTEISEGIIYFGQWENCLQHGKGIQLSADLSLYIGEFAFGKFNGIGKLINTKGEVYEGFFQDGLPNGKGVQVTRSGKKIVAEFNEGEIVGDCIIKWGNATYVGGYFDQQKNGTGKLQYDDKVYEGEFLNDLIEGYGTCVWNNGKKYQGHWKHNKMHGFGTFKWPDGKVYEGEYWYGLKNGIGKMTWPDGKKYYGEWAKGIQHGEAEYTYYNKISGEFITRKGLWEKGQRLKWL